MSWSNLKTSSLLVADTGPLLGLARIGFLPVLAKLFASICVTTSVLNECLAKYEHPDAVAIRQAINDGYLQLVEDLPVRASLLKLDRGEQTAIEYALTHHAAVLIDEKSGREAANAHGVKFIGAVGVLLLAKECGYLDQVKPKVIALVESSYFLNEALIANVVELAGE